MKPKIILLIPVFLLVIMTDSYGQWNPVGSGDVYTNGNVGIGTNTNLDAKLSLDGDSNWHLKLSNSATGGNTWRIGSTSDSWSASGGKFVISNNGSSATAAMIIRLSKKGRNWLI